VTRPIDVQCPLCKAAPGRICVPIPVETVVGPDFHADRLEAAIRADAAEWQRESAEELAKRAAAKKSAEKRQRLTALVAAGTKLDTAARLVKDAVLDIQSTNLLTGQWELGREVSTKLDALVQYIVNTLSVLE
jgi:hypothetical protein